MNTPLFHLQPQNDFQQIRPVSGLMVKLRQLFEQGEVGEAGVPVRLFCFHHHPETAVIIITGVVTIAFVRVIITAPFPHNAAHIVKAVAEEKLTNARFPPNGTPIIVKIYIYPCISKWHDFICLVFLNFLMNLPDRNSFLRVWSVRKTKKHAPGPGALPSYWAGVNLINRSLWKDTRPKTDFPSFVLCIWVSKWMITDQLQTTPNREAG